MASECSLRFGSPFRIRWERGQPQVPREYMRLVVGALFVEQLRLCLPVKPSIVERTVRVTNETGLTGAAPPEQGVPYPAGVEPIRSLHDDRVPLRNLFVPKSGLK